MMVDLVAGELDRVHERIAGRFGRAEPRARVRKYVSGLVAGLERKNEWTLAEQAGEASPDGRQRLLRRADWDVDGVRDDVRDYVTTRSAPSEPGMPTSPCPCSPMHGSPPAEPRRKKGDRHSRPRHDRLHVTGDPPGS
jgi:hypothetical protein